MDKYQRLRNGGKLFGTIKRARVLHDNRMIAKTVKSVQPLSTRYNSKRILIPLGSPNLSASPNITQILKENTRKKNWSANEPGLTTHLRTTNFGQYSRKCKYTKYGYALIVQSYGIVLKYKNTLLFKFDGRTYSKKAPKGYKWDSDKNGIKLVSLRYKDKDYHPTSSELLRQDWFNILRNRANEYYKIRRETARLEKESLIQFKSAIKTDCHVRLNDSIKSGNCLAGTLNWLKDKGINNTYILLKDLSKYLNDKRVKLACLFAVRRHFESLKLGFSKL